MAQSQFTPTPGVSTHGDAETVWNNNATDAESRLSVVENKSYAAGYITGPVASDAITAGVYINLLTNTTVTGDAASADWDLDVANSRWIYTGTDTKLFVATGSISAGSTKALSVLSFKVAKNGTPEDSTLVSRKLGNASDIGAMPIAGLFSMATNDYLELHGTLSASSSDTVTVDSMTAILHEVLTF
jgi:hypothetical protein